MSHNGSLRNSLLESVAALRRGLALYSVIAWRILYATLLTWARPDLPYSVLLALDVWQAIDSAIHKTPTPPATPPTLRRAICWIAQLCGFLGRTSDREPGAQILWRGLQRLSDLTRMYLVFSPHAETWVMIRTLVRGVVTAGPAGNPPQWVLRSATPQSGQ